MNDAGAIGLAHRELLLTNMVNHGVGDGVRSISGTRMHRDSSWLIEHDQMSVLKEDLKGKV
jgi:hypothetical protein